MGQDNKSRKVVDDILESDEIVYGINTDLIIGQSNNFMMTFSNYKQSTDHTQVLEN